MKRPYIHKVASNLKSPCPDGAPWTLELGPKTLLVGSNTSHKSSVIQSLELAFAGSADDVVGRSAVRDAALLLTLAPADSLGVTGYLTDDTVATYLAKREGGVSSRPSHAGPGEESLVHRQVRSVMGGSVATQRKAFLRWTSLGVQLEDILAQLPTELHAVYKDLAEHLGHGATPVETLLSVIAYCEKRVRDLNKEVRGAQTVIDKISSGMTKKPSQEEYDNLKIAVDDAQALLEEAIKHESAVESYNLSKENHEMSSEKLSLANTAVEMWQNEITRLKTALEQARQNLGERPEQAVHSLANLKWAIDNGVESCPTCSTAIGKDHIQTCHTFYEQTLQNWDQQNAALLQSIDDYTASLHEAVLTHHSWVQEVHNLQLMSDITNHSFSEKSPPAEINDLPSVDECRKRLADLRETFTATEVAAHDWNQLLNAKRTGEALLKDKISYNNLASAANVAVGKVLTEQVDCFCANVTSYLPEKWDFRIILKDGKSDVFRMGLMRDGRLHSALSGVEWVSVTTAIAMTICDNLNHNTPVLLVPEDRAWDGTTLSAVMRGYCEFDGQVIIASTVKPSGRIPKGWTIVEMDQVTADWTQGKEATPEPETVPVVEEVKAEEPPAPIVKKPKRRRRKVSKETAEIMTGMGYTVLDIRHMSKQTAADIMQHSYGSDRLTINEDGTYTLAEKELPPAPV
jgi:predicted  nucleic acid-binding Zn-ribbon protein